MTPPTCRATPGCPHRARCGWGRPERPTRKPMALWDRTKFLLLFTLLFWFFVWSEYSDPSPPSTRSATRPQDQGPLFVLAGIELVRQLHYLVSEHWSCYRFWSDRCSGASSAAGADWNRYRLARALKVGGSHRERGGCHLRRHAPPRRSSNCRPAPGDGCRWCCASVSRWS